MKIWTNNGTDDVVLCDHGRGGPSNFVPQVIRNKDVLQFVQGPFAKPKGRGNAYRSWQFAAQFSHDTITAAQIYLITLHSVVPEQADVFIELEDHATQYKLPDTFIEFAPTAPIGCLTTVLWTITFGGLQPLAAPAVQLADSNGVLLNDSGGSAWNFLDATFGEPI